MTGKDVIAFVRLGRPKFLGGGFILYGLGAAIAARHGHAIDWHRYLVGQGAVTAFQLMTHYANDYFDYDADRANATPTSWSGGSRVLPDGDLPRSVALIAALVLAALGITATIALAGAGALAVPTLALVLVLAWEYSAPPLRLCAAGLGELTTAIVVTVLVPWLGFYLQAPSGGGGCDLALTIVPLALLQIAMLVAIEFPDADGDARTEKRTLVVRLGAVAAARLYVVITALAFLWPAVAFAFGLPARVVTALAIPAPVAIWRMTQIRDHADAAAFERLTFWAVFLLVASSALALGAWLT
ncbi:MAG TPA: prenyltransferase [Kofleriaceae bacterium]|nr:prenyltransferase [Kofleriaceae bacterium]